MGWRAAPRAGGRERLRAQGCARVAVGCWLGRWPRLTPRARACPASRGAWRSGACGPRGRLRDSEPPFCEA
eukprot:2035949-Lingulodinium_polyedra.AAC.1